ncbi:putative leucine-rich repeat receptor-like serine/threonine-protein kinase At2g19230 [Corylus avellana]|uniref:putative leucine-rich repeat receptor-like serine/threonine-protein kinase At2g19230 n=1 Tax=Corylus avellana TaxID=13451 RepID=UPI001E220774|nr:putative leucine-rich repeat receptor-like serine/threonine-protein kinase At2g19230 [Corylus avellana]
MDLKAWLFFVSAIAILGHSKLAAAQNHHARRELAADIPGFISIDCGSDEDYLNEATGISYKSDKEMIDTGIAMTVFSDFGNIERRLLRSLRSFPNGTRNCYTLRPEQSKYNNYLVRATFGYGNYDGKNMTPTFDLYLGPNRWDTVNPETPVYYEIIYAPSTDYIDVCLVDTGHGVPFISTLELRRLDNSIYQIDEDVALSVHRYSIGMKTTELRIRYPDDVYDRYWNPFPYDNPWNPIATNSAIYTKGNDNPYKVPAKVLQTAATTMNASIPLSYYWSPPDSLSKYSFNFHFAEIEKLGAGQQREMTIDLNGDRKLAESVKLDYLKPLTLVQGDPPINGSLVQFSIIATEGTKFPPILNALEVFVLRELPNKPTAVGDVEAIMEIKELYSVTRNWQGDPCVPSNFSWDGLNCSNDNPPRIISLNLSSSKLAGEIAASFSNLKALQSLDLSYNDLTGPFPDVLAQLPYLNTLDLSGNKLTGSVPEALVQRSMDGKFALRVGDNPDLCLQLAPCKRKKKNKLVIPIVASSIIAVLVLLSTFAALAIYRRKRKRVAKSNIKSQSRRYSYSEVVSITNNFKTIIGRGGFGSVYLGTLKDDTQVAVKLLSPSSNQGYKEFQAEAQLLIVVHHRNLVSLVGYCDEGDQKKALIYEYMSNGNLQQQLSVTNTCVLKWNERLHIAVDAAHGLEYLHNGCKPPIIHRDLKTSNILLNEHMQAKIADFGLSRAFVNENDSHVSTRPAGTLGYLDPGFQASRIFNKKSDVYSFGIILFELITGQPAIVRGPVKNIHISEWINPLIERGDIQNIVDPRLEGAFNTNSAWKAVEIAMSCIAPVAIERPDMSNVLAELKECLAQERSQMIATKGLSKRTPSELESEFAPHAR